jgi:hypothetical protein
MPVAAAYSAPPQLKREFSLLANLGPPAEVIATSQVHSSYLARARISEFESYHPSHAVGLSEQKWSLQKPLGRPLDGAVQWVTAATRMRAKCEPKCWEAGRQ